MSNNVHEKNYFTSCFLHKRANACKCMIQAKHLPKWRIKSTNEINCNRQPSFQAIINLKFIVKRRKKYSGWCLPQSSSIMLFCTITRFIIALFCFFFSILYKNSKLNFDNFSNFLFTNPTREYYLNLLPNSTPE